MQRKKTTGNTEQEKKNNPNTIKQEVQIERPSAPPRKTTLQSVGIVHQKNLCTRCMKEDDLSKHPKREWLSKICEDKFLKNFKASVTYVQDPKIKLSLQTCVNSISDPFSTEILHHDYCRKKYLQPIYSTDETSEQICKM